ncbi:hypothetical protein HOLleu_22140 [Holothuria leucospilota]|uniref:Uncharacterized protein n=1 Tax=Holothuria leucospilota TaxID=206669 RepID=A0A9Q1H6Y4_HOLLE|nr:hypothetical protein HOLleu_22140 [Holothuria leucospilota]
MNRVMRLNIFQKCIGLYSVLWSTSGWPGQDTLNAREGNVGYSQLVQAATGNEGNTLEVSCG